MIIDKTLEFANKANLPGTSGRANVGDVVDLGAGGNTRIGDGCPTWLVIMVTSAIDSAVDFHLVSDSTSTPSTSATGTGATIHGASGEIPQNKLTVGSRVVIPLAPGREFERYVGIQSDGTRTVGTGAISAFITLDPPANWYAGRDAQN